MNLLQNRITPDNDPEAIYSTNFRIKQYERIPDFLKLMVNYLSKLNKGYLQFKHVHREEQISYRGIYNSQVTKYDVYVNDTSDLSGKNEKIFLRILMPTLIHDNFFILNDNLYVPTMYITDLPIVIKNKSIMLSSTFNSVTLYMKDNIAIFTGVNIPLENFLQLFLMDDVEDIKLYGEFIAKHKLRHSTLTEQNILNYFKNKFNVKKDKNSVIDVLERTFLDEHAINLYKASYGLEEVNLRNIIRNAITIDINDESPNFIDLSKKRLVFIEILMRPLFERVAGMVKQVSAGFKVDEIRIDQMVILKTFLTSKDLNKKRKGLCGNFLYNTANLFSGVLQNKISMVQPGVENAPQEVQGIHPSHFGKICPISVSSQSPGEVVSIIPGNRLNWYGMFI